MSKLYKINDIFISNEKQSCVFKDAAIITNISTFNIVYRWYKNDYVFCMDKDIFEKAIDDDKYRLLTDEKQKLQFLLKF